MPTFRWILATLTVALVSSALASSMLDRASIKWDIRPNIILGVAKDAGHEMITVRAFDRLSPEHQAVLDKDTLKSAVRWNDMPENDEKQAGLISFLRKFIKAEKAKEGEDGSKTAIARSHVGCRQTWHAMSPVASMGKGDERKMLQFTNENVKTIIVANDAYDWWHRGVMAARKHIYSGAKDDNKIGDNLIARLLHMVQDSFAPGHTIRGRKADDPCGDVVLYQGYTMQHGNGNHGKADHDPDDGVRVRKWLGKDENTIRRAELQKCAEDKVNVLLGIYATCKLNIKTLYEKKLHNRKLTSKEQTEVATLESACLVPYARLNEIFAVREDQKDAISGGSSTYYSEFYDADKEKMDAAVKKIHNVKVRSVEVFTGPTAFEDCSRPSEKKDHCIYDIHEMVGSPNGFGTVPFDMKRQGRNFLVYFCGNQASDDENAVGEKKVKVLNDITALSRNHGAAVKGVQKFKKNHQKHLEQQKAHAEEEKKEEEL